MNCLIFFVVSWTPPRMVLCGCLMACMAANRNNLSCYENLFDLFSREKVGLGGAD